MSWHKRANGKWMQVTQQDVLKAKCHSHHQVDRWDLVPSWSLAQGNTVGLLLGLGTRYGIYLHMSRDLEVTPPCSIRPLPFGDVLVVRTRNDWQKSERRLVKKRGYLSMMQTKKTK